MFNILVINPGSTSTKVALFDDDKLVKSHSIAHAVEDLQVFSKAIDQLDYRLNLILEYLEKFFKIFKDKIQTIIKLVYGFTKYL